MSNHVLLSDPYNLEFNISVRVNEEIELLFGMNYMEWNKRYKYKAWYQNDKLNRIHRLDGPARVWFDGTEEYWIEGKRLSKEEFMRRTNAKVIPIPDPPDLSGPGQDVILDEDPIQFSEIIHEIFRKIGLFIISIWWSIKHYLLGKEHWEYEVCQCCGRPNFLGFNVSDVDWAAIVGDKNKVLCLRCFDELAKNKNLSYNLTGLYLVLEKGKTNKETELIL